MKLKNLENLKLKNKEKFENLKNFLRKNSISFCLNYLINHLNLTFSLNFKNQILNYELQLDYSTDLIKNYLKTKNSIKLISIDNELGKLIFFYFFKECNNALIDNELDNIKKIILNKSI